MEEKIGQKRSTIADNHSIKGMKIQIKEWESRRCE